MEIREDLGRQAAAGLPHGSSVETDENILRESRRAFAIHIGSR